MRTSRRKIQFNNLPVSDDFSLEQLQQYIFETIFRKTHTYSCVLYHTHEISAEKSQAIRNGWMRCNHNVWPHAHTFNAMRASHTQTQIMCLGYTLPWELLFFMRYQSSTIVTSHIGHTTCLPVFFLLARDFSLYDVLVCVCECNTRISFCVFLNLHERYKFAVLTDGLLLFPTRHETRSR